MIRFFKFSGPFQLLIIVLVVVITKTIFYFSNHDLPILVLQGFVLGEKLHFGLLYRDVISFSAPIPAYFFYLIDSLFGRSELAYMIFGGIVVFINTYLISYLLRNSDVFSIKGDFISFIYVVLSSCSADFQYLTPSLLATMFILMGLNVYFRYIKTENDETGLFKTGFYFGLAFLCFKYTIFLFPFLIIVNIIFSRTILRFYALYCVGFIFPSLSLMVFYFFNDGFDALMTNYLFIFDYSFVYKTSVIPLNVWFLPITLFTFIGILVTFNRNSFIVSQIIYHRIILFFLLFMLLLDYTFTQQNEWIFLMLPFASIFLGCYFMFSKNRKWPYRFLNITFIYLIFNHFTYLVGYDYKNFSIQYLPQSSYPQFINKKILMLGDENAVFKNNKMATGFADLPSLKRCIENFEYYEDVILFYEAFKIEKPDLIIDEWKLFPTIAYRIPAIKAAYETTDGKIYMLKNGSKR